MFGKPYTAESPNVQNFTIWDMKAVPKMKKRFIFSVYILTTGAKHREWIGMVVAGTIIDSYCGSFPGWWFGTMEFYDFPYYVYIYIYWEFHHPT